MKKRINVSLDTNALTVLTATGNVSEYVERTVMARWVAWRAALAVLHAHGVTIEEFWGGLQGTAPQGVYDAVQVLAQEIDAGNQDAAVQIVKTLACRDSCCA